MYFDTSNDLESAKSIAYFNKLINLKSKIELKKITQKRSVTINSYLHVCISIYAIEFGYTLNESKTYLKRVCPFMVYEKKGVKFLKETSKMNNEEVSLFIEWLRNYSSVNGLYIPTADEYKSNKFTIDKEIDNYKEHL